MVEDSRQGFAAQPAIAAFYAALAAAEFRVEMPGWRLLLDLEPLSAAENDDV